MAGERIPYWMVARGDHFYVRRGEWTTKNYAAAFMVRELAEQVSKRYPGSSVEQDTGFGVFHKRTLDDVGEPDAQKHLESALKLAVLEIPKSDIEAIVRGVLDPAPESLRPKPNNFEVIENLPGTLRGLSERIAKLEQQMYRQKSQVQVSS